MIFRTLACSGGSAGGSRWRPLRAIFTGRENPQAPARSTCHKSLQPPPPPRLLSHLVAARRLAKVCERPCACP
eukprot:jgi/Mesen1/8792/ME000528S08193